jgi:phage-related minor tail protein
MDGGAWRNLQVVLSAKTGDFERGLAGAERSLARLDSTTTGSMSSLMSWETIALGSMVTVGAGMLKLGSDFHSAYATIRTETGATGASLKGLEKAYNDVLRQRPDSMRDVATAIALVNQRLHDTGPALEAVSIAELRLASITKTDLTGNITATSQVLNAYGVATDQQVHKLDELYRTHELTGISVSDLASTMASTSGITKAYGLSFEQSAALVGLLHKSGLDAGPVMMGLGHSLKTAATNGQDAGTYLANLFKVIKASPNDTAAAGVAIDAFGARAGKLGVQIREGKLDYQGLVAQIANGNDTIEKAAVSTATFSSKWKTFLNGLRVDAQPIATGLFDGLTKSASAVLPPLSAMLKLLAAHPAVIEAVAVAFAGWGVVKVVDLATVAASGLFETLSVGAFTAVGSLGGTTSAAEALQAALVGGEVSAGGMMTVLGGLGAAAGRLLSTLGPLAVALVGFRVFQGYQEAGASGSAFGKKLGDIEQPHSIASVGAEADAAKAAVARLKAELYPDGQNFLAKLGTGGVAGMQMVGHALGLQDELVLKHQKQMENAEAQEKRSAAQSKLLGSTVDDLAKTYGLSTTQVRQLLEADTKLDVRTATSKDLQASLAKTLSELSTTTGMTKDSVISLADAVAASGQKWADWEKGREKAMSTASGAIAQMGDLSKVSFKAPTGASILDYLHRTRVEAGTFLNDISTLTKKGLDPTLVSNFLAAGPEQAGATVHALAISRVQDLIGQVNKSEAQIGKLSAYAAEQAQLTWIATTNLGQKYADNLPNAQRIVEMSAAGIKPIDIAKKLWPDATGPELQQKFNDLVTMYALTVGRIGDKDIVPSVNTGPAGKKVNAMMDAWRRSSPTITPKADTAKASRDLDHAARPRGSSVKPWVDPLSLTNTSTAIDWLTRPRTILLSAQLAPMAQQPPGGVLHPYGSNPGSTPGAVNRWGGVHSYAGGGIGDGRRTLYQWNEPGTGGEAFIPRNIPHDAALPLLQTAAAWHGFNIGKVPNAGAGRSGGIDARTTVSVQVDARGATDPQAVAAAARDGVLAALKADPRPIAVAISEAIGTYGGES